MQPSRKSPCYLCESRELFCHMTCARYADFRAALDDKIRRNLKTSEYEDAVTMACQRMHTIRPKDMRGGVSVG